MKNIYIVVSFLFSVVMVGQSLKLDGTIVDVKGKAIEMANIMAVNMASKAMDSYAITNEKGKFSLALKPGTHYSVNVSYLGMQSKTIEIVTGQEDITKTITLEEGGIELEGVEIVHDMPVSIKGDTIVYNADSFKSGTERKLEDILKKLPGVEVNDDGEVEVEGKKVTKLMIEGKDFFDGDTKLGVQNIPADAIDKIQVLRNFSEVGALKGVENNEESVAMNIKLKSGKKNFWFGDVTAGVGVAHEESRYVINPKLFYYSPKYSINLITNFNNIGELPLTIQDYFKFTGGFRGVAQKGGSSFDVSSNDLGISLLRNNRAQDIETKFGATNFSYNVNKAWNISGFGILTSSNTDLDTKTQTTILGSGAQQNSEEIAAQKSNFGMFKLSSSYKPNEKLQLDYDVLTKVSKQDELSSLTRESIVKSVSTTEDIFTNKKQNPISVNQNLNLYYTKNDKNIFAFEAQHLFQDENPFYNANLKSQPFNLTDYVSGQSRNNINQDRFVKTNKIDAKLDYYYMLTKTSNINVTVGDTYSNQDFNSHIFQLLDNQSVNDLTAPQDNNQVKYNFNDVFLGLHYKILTGKFTFNPGVSLHYYDMTNTQLGSDHQQNFYRALPDFFALFQIKKSQTLSYNYSLTNNFTDINKLAEGSVLSNYSSLFSGNRLLENATSQVHSLRYFKYNMYNFENIFANASYSKMIDAVKTSSVFMGVNQVSTSYNSNLADETLSGAGSYGRSFLRSYKASFSTSVNWSKFNNIQNSSLRTTQSLTQSYTVKASTNYKNLPNLEVGYNYIVNKYSGATFFTDKPFLKLDYYFLNAFSFVSEYEFYNYRNDTRTIQNQYDFLSASMIYQKKNSKMEYKLGATNILNTKSLNDNNFTQFATSNSQYTVQPRYVVFSMKYNL
ncbi:carboxypeptidase regulatory-like domain-containing protein [Flavobacterium sp. 7A]|uniref:carboxypeptidase regulatory-like domain-containing protein n=1 Tax=Flavobacterium sp. 7A TaxID=2940571 RepID=UPI002225BB6B|nr:carboxypeptidase regulatory-like domain-containing protein [Flavobacterium sp. 7A]MCW2118646.1 hypothetical protein [Flavobacterium sp. 7A]